MIAPKSAKLHINSGDKVNSLITKNIALVSWFIGRYPKPKHLSNDEYWSEMMVALYNAAVTFDESKARFSTYANHGMFLARLKLLQQARTIKRKVHAPIIDDVIGEDSTSTAEFVAVHDGVRVINKLMSVLSDYQKQVVTDVLATGSRREVAVKMGKHRCTIYECYRECVRKMRKKAQEEGIECPI